MEKKLRVIEMACAIAGCTFYSLTWIMSFWLWKAMPIHPDIEQNFAIPMIIHGRTIYLSNFYNNVYNTLLWGGGMLFFVAALIDFYKDPFNRRVIV